MEIFGRVIPTRYEVANPRVPFPNLAMAAGSSNTTAMMCLPPPAYWQISGAPQKLVLNRFFRKNHGAQKNSQMLTAQSAIPEAAAGMINQSSIPNFDLATYLAMNRRLTEMI